MEATVEQAYDVEDRRGRWVQTVGIAAIVAAAVATILMGTPAMPESPSTDSSCQLDLVRQQWTGTSCHDTAVESAAR